jgi:sigma-B regulation protein RsbU (phosphoserine phosphatase)
MALRRVADTPTPSRRRQVRPALALPPGETSEPARDLLLRSWPGRLVLVAFAVKLLVAFVRLFAEPPAFLRVLSTTATIALLVALTYFVARLVLLVKRRLLWRVRRKLILSYIFIGVVPALLIAGFFVFGAFVLSMNISAYLFKDGYDEIARNAASVAEAAASEISRTPAGVEETIARVQQNGAAAFDIPFVSLTFIPEQAGQHVVAGEWRHAAAPREIPGWLKKTSSGWLGTVAVPSPDTPGETELVARAVRHAVTAKGRIGQVVVDIPIDDTLVDRLYEKTGVKAGYVSAPGTASATDAVAAALRPPAEAGSGPTAVFRHTVVYLDATDWPTGAPQRAWVSVTYQIRQLYDRIAAAQAVDIAATGGRSLADVYPIIVIFVAVLFLIIQAAALTMGFALARSITSSIHELFMGTERVRHGDFTHRINIHTKDQLGELADSFNQMTGSIENLLQTAAEKKRLEEELRIARQIQMSLLPRGPLEMPGLGVTALCVPAREVGGDYYDFFPLGHDRLGVLIADVSGKGTSAALYMAELKGLVLSLSQIYQSPRELLLEVNRIISENLDSRSFITMSYAVLDLKRGVMTFARAGHTPLIYLPGRAAARRDAQVLTPNGMVVGLRIEGAAAKFAELLEEEQLTLDNGDVIVLYTDGITEAMNDSEDLFGEGRLSRLVEEHGHLASGELRERILREIEAFVGGADQHDDMTMILIKVERAGAARVAV